MFVHFTCQFCVPIWGVGGRVVMDQFGYLRMISLVKLLLLWVIDHHNLDPTIIIYAFTDLFTLSWTFLVYQWLWYLFIFYTDLHLCYILFIWFTLYHPFCTSMYSWLVLHCFYPLVKLRKATVGDISWQRKCPTIIPSSLTKTHIQSESANLGY